MGFLSGFSNLVFNYPILRPTLSCDSFTKQSVVSRTEISLKINLSSLLRSFRRIYRAKARTSTMFRNNCFCLSYFVLVILRDLEWQNRLFLQISFNKSFLSKNNKCIYRLKKKTGKDVLKVVVRLFTYFLSLSYLHTHSSLLWWSSRIYASVCLFQFYFFFFFFYLHPEWMNVLHSVWMSAETSFLPFKQSKTFPFPRLFSFKYCDRSLLDYLFEPLKTSKNTYKQRICPQVILQSVVGSRLNLSAVRAVFLWLS